MTESHPSPAVERVLAALEGRARRVGAGHRAPCPAHEDHTPSLSIAEGKDGRALLHCHGGCTPEQILQALSLTWADLHMSPSAKSTSRVMAERGDYTTTTTYDYRDEEGTLLFQVVRYAPRPGAGKPFAQRRPDGSGGWIDDLKGVRRVLYRLPELLAASADEPVYITEGEKDCDNLRGLGAIATTNPMGAGKWLKAYNSVLRDRNVVILPDNDEAGQRHSHQVANALYGKARTVRLVCLPGLTTPGEDLSNWLERGGTLTELARLTETADEFDPIASAGETPRATDLGNARLFAREHSHSLRYVAVADKWFVWDGRRWVVDRDEHRLRCARETVRALYAAADNLTDSSERKALAKWAERSESRARINAMVELARSEQSISLLPEVFDSDSASFLMTVNNGTIDLKTGQLRPHRREDMITKLATVAYDPEAKSVLWNDVLEHALPDPEMRAFLKRFIGSALTGDVGDERFVLFHGDGATGKSTVISTILSMMGDYGLTANFETFLSSSAKVDRRGAPREDLMSLCGARLVAAVEAEDGRRLDETMIKALTGGDSIRARRLYQSEETFSPAAKLVLVANRRPEVRSDGGAFWRRALELPFTIVIPEGKRDPLLKRKLSDPKNLSAVLAWAVQGCLDWQSSPDECDRLCTPNAVRAATHAYRVEQDDVGEFLADACEFEPSASVTANEFRLKYRIWAMQAGRKPRSTVEVARRLVAEGARPDRVGKRRERVWLGIRLRHVD